MGFRKFSLQNQKPTETKCVHWSLLNQFATDIAILEPVCGHEIFTVYLRVAQTFEESIRQPVVNSNAH